MTERPEQPPEGRLIGLAQKRAKLSGRKAAELAEMSEGRWRQIVSGYQTVSAGVYAPVRAPADTLARMARVVGVTPEDLEGAGRADAAAELRLLLPGTAAEADEDGAVRLTVIVNPGEPEPAEPPGGIRDQVEAIIWAIQEPWAIRWAQIQARRAILAPIRAHTEERHAKNGQ